MIKFRAFIQSLDMVLDVQRIFFDFKTVHCFINDELIQFTFDEIVLLQSTGYLDINGREIFEGDIIEYEDWRCSKQTWLYKSSKHDGFVPGFRGYIRLNKEGFILNKNNTHNYKKCIPMKGEREQRHTPYIYKNEGIENIHPKIIGNIFTNEILLHT